MAGSRQVKAGKAFYEVFLREKVAAGLKKIDKVLSSTGRKVAGLGTGLFAVGGAALGPIAALTFEFGKLGDEVAKASDRTGASAEFLSQMGFAAEQSGTKLSSFVQGLFRMTRRIANAETATGPAVRALDELGLSAAKIGALKPEDQFFAIADALGGVANAERRAQLGFELIGDNIRDLTPLLNAGSAGIRAMQKEADALGRTIGSDQAAQAAAFNDAWNRVLSTFRAVRLAIGAAFVEELTSVANKMAKITVTAIEFVKTNKDIILQVGKVAVVISGVGVALLAVGGVIVGVGAVFGSLATLAGGLATAIGIVISSITFLVSPIGAVVAGLGVLVAAIVQTSAGGGTAIGFLTDAFNKLKKVVGEVLQGVSDALAAGDVGLAAKLLWLKLKIEWEKGTAALNDQWVEWKSFFLLVANEAISSVASVFIKGFAAVDGLWERSATAFRKVWAFAVEGLKNQFLTMNAEIEKFLLLFRKLKDSSVDIAAETRRINEEVKAKQFENLTVTDEGIENRQRARDAKLAQIEEERARSLADIEDMKAKREAAIFEERNKNLSSSNEELAKATKEYNDALAVAAKKRESIERGEGEGLGQKINTVLAQIGNVSAVSLKNVAKQAGTIEGTLAERIFGRGGTDPTGEKTRPQMLKELKAQTAALNVIKKNKAPALKFGI